MLKASYSALYFTTFESAQEMVWRVTALKSFEGSKAEFGWNHEVHSSQYSFWSIGLFYYFGIF